MSDTRTPLHPSGPGDAAAARKALLDRWRDSAHSLGLATGEAGGVIRRQETAGPVPAALAQVRLWFLDQLHPHSAVNNLVFCARVDGRLDAGHLADAVDRLVDRHETLRTVIRPFQGEPHQFVLDEARARLDVIDLRSAPDDGDGDSDGAALDAVDAAAHEPFDLATGPLSRWLLVRSAGHDLLAMVSHHIISDGWSLGVALRDLDALYRAAESGSAPSPVDLPVRFSDVARWQRDPVREEEWAAGLDHWKNRLAGAVPLDLPTDRPRPGVLGTDGDWRPFTLSTERSDAVRALARRHDVSTFMVLEAAFAVLLGKLSGLDDVAIGTAVANRPHVETNPLIGDFVNLVVLRNRLDGDPTVAEVLERARTTCLEAFARQAVPFERVVEAVAPRRDPSRNALFQALLVLQPPTPDLALAGHTLEPVERAVRAVQTDVELHLWDLPAVTGRLAYNTELFDADSMDLLLQRLHRVLDRFVEAPDTRLSDLSVLVDGEAETLRGWGTGPAVIDDGTEPLVIDRILAHAADRPDAVAVAFRDDEVSYVELDRRTAAGAARLRDLGVGPETLVGLCLERSADLLVAALAILRSGGAYVPLDPRYPQDRLAFMVDDAAADLVVTDPERHEALARPGRTVLSVEELLADADGDRPGQPCPASPDHLAYVIYTSGSTGTPKGVQITHRSLANIVDAMIDTIGIGPDDRVASVASLSFDASVTEVFPVLAAGGTLAVVPECDTVDGHALAERLSAHGVTVLQATATTWRLLELAGVLDALGCRALVGGEPTPHDLAARIAGRPRPAWNMYGPTETTVWSTGTVATVERPVSLGRPLRANRVHVLDDDLKAVPVGVVGELCIAGRGLARGYLRRPALTAERFVPDPSGEHPGGRLYRTGDLARWRKDGALEFVARKDHQVKLRGHRIELGEIETVLLELETVAAAVVVLYRPEPDDASLVAYVQPAGVLAADEEVAGIEKWRRHLHNRLPAWMVPSRFVLVDSFPTTPTGKIDRARLPAPTPRARGAGRPPATPLERDIAGRIGRALDVDDVSLDDDFFALGGHSVLAARLMADLAGDYGLELHVQELFIVPTVSHLVEYIEQEQRAKEIIEQAGPRLRRMVETFDEATIDSLLAQLERRHGTGAPDIGTPETGTPGAGALIDRR